MVGDVNKSIEWHKECLKNREDSLNSDKKFLEIERIRLNKCRLAVSRYQAQISIAEKEGKKEFDREKYAIKRLGI